MHQIKEELTICSFVHLQLKVSASKLVLLSEFLDLFPLFIKRLSHVLSLPLLLLELPLSLFDISFQKFIVVALCQCSAFFMPLVEFILHKLESLHVKRNECETGAALPITISLFKLQSKTILLFKEGGIALKDYLSHDDVQTIVTFLI